MDLNLCFGACFPPCPRNQVFSEIPAWCSGRRRDLLSPANILSHELRCIIKSLATTVCDFSETGHFLQGFLHWTGEHTSWFLSSNAAENPSTNIKSLPGWSSICRCCDTSVCLSFGDEGMALLRPLFGNARVPFVPVNMGFPQVEMLNLQQHSHNCFLFLQFLTPESFKIFVSVCST